MTHHLPTIATRIVEGINNAFPENPTRQQFEVLRQLSHLMEEVIEFDIAMEGISHNNLEAEAADVILTTYTVAVCAGFDLDAVIAEMDPEFIAELALWRPSPVRLAGIAMQTGRRWLGISRRQPEYPDEFSSALAAVVLGIQADARMCEIDLDQAITKKTEIIFSRPWRASESPHAAEA